MGKRKHEKENIEDYVKRKMKKIERKLAKAKCVTPSGSASLSRPQSSPPPPPIITEKPDEQIEIVSLIEDMPEEEFPGLLEVDNGPLLDCNHIPTKESIIEEDNLPEELLNILGETPCLEKKLGPAINKNIAIRWEHISTNGLEKELKKELMTKYKIPQNCQYTEAPTLNKEVKAALTDTLHKKDKAIENKQKQIAIISACLGQTLSKIIDKGNPDTEICTYLTDAGRLICDLQYTESMTRRSFVCSSIKKEIKDHLYNTKIDDHLFGKDLGEVLKSAKTINKTGAEMKTPATGTSKRFPGTQNNNLNFRRPSQLPSRQMGAVARRQMPAPVSAGQPHNYPQRQPHQRHFPRMPLQPRVNSSGSRTQAPHRR